MTWEIRVHINYWETVLEVIGQDNPAAHDLFLEEFRVLLGDRFGAISFSKAEVKMLFSSQFLEAWQSVRKLQDVIDRIKDEGKTLGYRVSTEKTKEAYGVYFMNDTGERQLWFGMWAPFSQDHGFPLCFGIQDSKAAKIPELKSAFESVSNGATKHCRGWTMGWVTHEVFDATDPVNSLWTKLALILRAVLGNPSK